MHQDNVQSCEHISDVREIEFEDRDDEEDKPQRRERVHRDLLGSPRCGRESERGCRDGHGRGDGEEERVSTGTSRCAKDAICTDPEHPTRGKSR